MTQEDQNPPPEDEWTSEEHTKLMSRYERIAAESAGAPSKDGKSVVAEFSLGGAVPRHEPSRRQYQSSDIYVRLENTIYGPITQDELAEMLASGELTGFESASADLKHWTPLIYHPKMTLSGEIDPDATHGMLHNRSTLPAASRAPDKFDLEALADMDDDEALPAMPLAAILIKPIKVSRKTGLPIKVHADLAKESIEDVIKRTDIPEVQRMSGAQALVELVEGNDARLGDTDEIPPLRGDGLELTPATGSGWDSELTGADAPKASEATVTGATTKPASEQMSALVDAEIESLYADLFGGFEAEEASAPAEAEPVLPERVASSTSGVVDLIADLQLELDPADSESLDIEIDEVAIAAMRGVSAEEPLLSDDAAESMFETGSAEMLAPSDTPAAAPAKRGRGGNRFAAYIVAMLMLAVAAVVALALLTQTTPGTAPDEPAPVEPAPEAGEEAAVEGAPEAAPVEAAPAEEPPAPAAEEAVPSDDAPSEAAPGEKAPEGSGAE